MSVQDKIKMFNQIKLPSNQCQSDKNINQINKEKEANEENKKKGNETKKDNKDKSKEEKDKNKEKKSNIKLNVETPAPTTIQEKMKSLELYYKLRSEGWNKSYTEGPKNLEKIENNVNFNTPSKTLEKKVIKEWAKDENETMLKLEIEQDAYEFNEENYKNRRYDKKNVESGKKFFKLRYITNNLKNSVNAEKKEKENTGGGEEENQAQQQSHDKERILRKYNSDFIIIIEKSILSFNVKNYKESYEFLESAKIIKNIKEYGEFLLVVSGFDKFLIGEFLAKQKYPNDKKEVLKSFIESINMKKNETTFIDCLRFIFSRLILPKDANLILEIMDEFSVNYFETNKSDNTFVDIFKSSNNVYLLISTILALNTMFTRKDIKIKNVIKKEEFIKMNSGISKDFIEKLYDEIKKSPIIMSDDYNESMYRKLAPLVKEDESGKLGLKNSKSSPIIEENKNINLGSEEKSDENNSSNNLNKNNERTSKDNNTIEEQAVEEDEDDDDFYDEEKKGLEKKEFSLKTNLEKFTEEDEKLLKTPHKLYKINNGSKSSVREYMLNDDKTKLYYDKKQKKSIPIKNIIDVYNGINHSHNANLLKYIKNNPSEEQFSGNFISLIFKSDKDQVDLMSDDLESALRWFKAFKSLILLQGNKRNKYAKAYENAIRRKTEETWNNLLNKWNVYGKYLIMKLMERNRFIQKDEKQNSNSNSGFTNKEILMFLKNINGKKLSKDKELDYNEFFKVYYFGLPNLIRNKIWQILIGNPCGILTNTYELVKKQVPKINFSELEISNTNKNYCQDYISNKIINEIIKSKDLFINNEEEKSDNVDLNPTMNKIYNIARSFYVLRPDIPYNKSIISIIFLFLCIFDNESNTFCNVVNLICSNELKIFIGDENEIKNYCSFFNILLKKYLDKIEKHFTKLEIVPQLYIVPWFEELFTRTLCVKLSCHVFDLFLIYGEVILYQTSLAIIKMLEEELLNLTVSEVFKALERFPENISEVEFISNIKKYSCIKKEFFDWKLTNELGIQKTDLFEIILSSK